MKKVLSILISMIMAFSSIFCVNVMPAQAGQVLLGVSGVFADGEYVKSYKFRFDDITTITINYTSEKESKLVLNDYYWDYDEINTNYITSYSETVTLTSEYYILEVYSRYSDNNTFTLTVEDTSVRPSKVKISKKKLTLGIYDGYQLDYSYTPSNALSYAWWSSSNEKVATVSDEGYVTPKGLGTANIKIITENDKSAKCKVVVNWSYLACFSGSSRKLPKINGKSGGKWTSSNKKIAKVKNGKVYALKAGNVNLKCKKGKITYTVRFHVVNYNTLLKKTKAALKDKLKDPDSLKIYHIWKGYYSDGDPTIVLDYGAKNSYGAMVRDNYYIGYSYCKAKTSKTVYGSYFSDDRPKLSSSKKLF